MSLKEGWITKQGQIRKNWKLRYFVLYNDGKLEYFKSEEKVKPLGHIDVREALRLEGDIKTSVTGYGFSIVLPTRTLILVSNTQKEGKAWEDCIKSVVTSRK